MRGEKGGGGDSYDQKLSQNFLHTSLFSGPKVCVLSDQWAVSFPDSNAPWTGNEARLIQTSLQ